MSNVIIGSAATTGFMEALKRGFMSRCPRCGTGRMFGKYLKVNDHCAECGNALHHHRADDFPPYLVIFIVGHVIITGVMVVEARTDWSVWAHFALWAPLTILMSLALLQPIKGAVVALQWKLGMHGFSGEEEST